MASTKRKPTRRTTVTVRYTKRKSRDPAQTRKPPNKKKKSSAKSKAKVSENPIDDNEKDFNIADYLSTIQETEKSVIRTENESIAISSCDVTESHFKRKHKMENSFISGIGSVYTKDGKQKWAKMLEPVENPNYAPGNSSSKTVPRAFVAVAGNVTRAKLMLCNAMTVDHQVNLKRVRKKKGSKYDCYAPSTQAVELRTFFSHMSKMHDWRMTEKDLSGFKGSLAGVMEKIFEQRQEKYVSHILFLITK